MIFPNLRAMETEVARERSWGHVMMAIVHRGG
jgi:hypothetical protein